MFLLLPFGLDLPSGSDDTAASSEAGGASMEYATGASDLATSSEVAGGGLIFQASASDLAQSTEDATVELASWVPLIGDETSSIEGVLVGSLGPITFSSSSCFAVETQACDASAEMIAWVDSTHFVTGKFLNASGVLYNPASVKVIAIFISERTGQRTRTEYVYGVAAELTRPVTGTYVLAFPCTEAGVVEYSYISPTVGEKAIAEGTFRILPRRVE